MPIEQIQKFLGHAKLETTQVYAESTPEMIKDSYRRALARMRSKPPVNHCCLKSIIKNHSDIGNVIFSSFLRQLCHDVAEHPRVE